MACVHTSQTCYTLYIHRRERYFILLFLSFLMNLFLLITYEVPSNLRETNQLVISPRYPPPSHSHLYPHTLHFPNHFSSLSQYQCDLSGGDRCIYANVSGLVYNCSLHLWGLPPVLLPVDAGRVLPHKLEELCVATNPLLSHSSVCVCMCVCMSVSVYVCQFACFFHIVMPPFSWHEPPEETYSDVNIFGLQTVYVVVSICTS